MPDFLMLRQALQRGRDFFSRCAVGGNDLILLENFQRGQRRPAGQRIAGIGMRMQKTARHIIFITG